MAIQIHDVKKSFGRPSIEILKGISANIQDKEFISITGRSGSGKSTLLYIISSLDRPTSGEVIVDGYSLQKMSPKEIHRFRNQEMGFVFQFHYLLPELTALENVLMPALKLGLDEKRRKVALNLLEEFDLSTKIKSLPSQLSGGEQQRVSIARALVMQPKIVFADEPTGNLDTNNGKIVMNLFKRINKEYGTTIIYVTHDTEFASLASRQISLVDGALSSDK